MRISTVPVVGSALIALLGVLVEPALCDSPPWKWQNPTPTGSTLRSVTFLDATTVIAIGDNGAAVRSNNAGLSWINIDTATGHSLHDVSFAARFSERQDAEGSKCQPLLSVPLPAAEQ